MSNLEKAVPGLAALALFGGVMGVKTCFREGVRPASHALSHEFANEAPAIAEQIVKHGDNALSDAIKPVEHNPHINSESGSMDEAIRAIIPVASDAIKNGDAEAKRYGQIDQLLVRDAQTGNYRIYHNGQYQDGSIADIAISNDLILRIADVNTITSAEKAILVKRGVKFLMNESYYQQIKSSRKMVQAVFVASQDDEKQMELFKISKEWLAASKQAFNPVFKNEMINTVETADELEHVISWSKDEDYTPVVIFNNDNNTLFGKDITQFSNPLITCNSYRFRENGDFVTLDFLNVKYINKVVSEQFTQSHFPTELEFFEHLYSGYADALKTERNFNIMMVVGVIGGTATGVTFIAYNVNPKKPKP